MDCRALRFARPDVTWFEVDDGALLDFKRERLAAAGIQPKSTFVQANYAAPGFIEALTASGLKPELPTLVVWEGNTYYLPPEVAPKVLKTLAAAIPDLCNAVDYFEPALIEGRSRSPGMVAVIRELIRLGAPWRYGIADISAFAAEAGLRALEVAEFGNLHAQYLPTEDAGEDVKMEYRMSVIG